MSQSEIKHLQEQFHVKGESPLLNLTNFDAVKGRVLDVQHQILGPAKEIFQKMFGPGIKSSDEFIQSRISEISDRINSLPFQTEESRISRPFRNLNDFIAEEFLVLLSIAPLVFLWSGFFSLVFVVDWVISTFSNFDLQS